jgi:hypothetical protein
MSTFLALFAMSTAAPAEAAERPAFDRTVQRVEQMTFDQAAQALVRRHGLGLMNVTWEDTGRSKGSVWGPNISDMTIGVRDGDGALHPMPVIRFDNFSDRTADLRSDRFWLRVGNHDGSRMRSVSLEEVLRDTERFLSLDTGDIRGSLWAERDEHVLVSAQAAFLPIPRDGEATFTPVLYNYQSRPDHPAVLTIVATREGTSLQVVENDDGYMSEVLYFNEDGQRAPFSATRLSDHRRAGGDGTHGSVSAAGEDGLNVVTVIQVPLKVEAPRRQIGWGWGDGAMPESAAPMAAKSADIEEAVISHGPVEGPFEELSGLTIERDPSFPVRVTVQFYQATSEGAIGDADVAAIRAQIDRVYDDAEYVGSLVTAGPTGRPTEWSVTPPRPVWAGTWSTGLLY